MAEEVFGFNSQDTDSLLRMIGKTQQPNYATGTDDSTRLVLAYTTGGATARSGTTLGKGTATMRFLAVSGTDRVLTETTDTVAIDFYNLAATTVGANRYLMLLRFGSDLVCVWEECI